MPTSTIFQIKRRTSGQAGISGVSLKPGELAYNEVDQKLYYAYLDPRITNWTGEYNNGVTYSVGAGVSYAGVDYVMTAYIGAAGYTPTAYPANWSVAEVAPQAVAGPGKLLSREINQTIVGSKTFTGVVDFTGTTSLVAVTPVLSTLDSTVATTEFVQNVFSYVDGGNFDGEGGGGGGGGTGAAVYMTSTSQSNDWFNLSNWEDETNAASSQLPLSSSDVTYSGVHTIVNIDDNRWVNPHSITVTTSSVLGLSSSNGNTFTSYISGNGTVNYYGNIVVNIGNQNLNLTRAVTFNSQTSALWSDLNYWKNSSGTAAGLLPDGTTNVFISSGNAVVDLDAPSWVYPATLLMNEGTTLSITSNLSGSYDAISHPISGVGDYNVHVFGNATLLTN